MTSKGVELPVDEAKAHIMAAWGWAERGNMFNSRQAGDPSFETRKLVYFPTRRTTLLPADIFQDPESQ